VRAWRQHWEPRTRSSGSPLALRRRGQASGGIPTGSLALSHRTLRDELPHSAWLKHRGRDRILTGQIDWWIIMAREVRASEAKTHFARLLNEVERGETIIITRHGQAIARIVPEARLRQEEIDQAIEDIKEFRKQTGAVTREGNSRLASRRP